ncbi:hypothetical protein HOLleu_34892 [Holothuria leucospilota]|uniref:Uncharacterized protein n=1 Tax=Holothuria leucospilota TaxID=206669 RepID=A0A9Q1BH16_HOLLE|nr:hypothetical protein HOLleu_34892 [Holothuria leucospilota]
MYIYINKYICTYIHTYIHTYTHTHPRFLSGTREMYRRARLLIAATEFSGSYASFELRVSWERRARTELSPAVPCPVKDMLLSAPIATGSLTHRGCTHTHPRFLSGTREMYR